MNRKKMTEKCFIDKLTRYLSVKATNSNNIKKKIDFTKFIHNLLGRHITDIVSIELEIYIFFLLKEAPYA